MKDVCPPRDESLASFEIFCESLEARIAPATLVDASTLTFQDTDGDAVTVSFSKKVLTSQETVDEAFSFAPGSETGETLQSLNLAALGLDPAKLRSLGISITAEAANGGDGFVDVGFLNAAGIDLGKVTVDGALAKIVAGDAKVGTAGIKALTVESLGLADGSEPENFSAVSSVITGALTKLHVSGDIAKAFLRVEGGARAGINDLFAGGSVVGGEAENSGSIQASGNIGKAVVEGSLQGGAGRYSGALMANAIGAVTIGGDMTGGSGATGWSGIVYAEGRLGKILVEGSLEGGAGTRSGMISAKTGIGSLEIQGDLIGGHGYAAGRVETAGGITKAVVLGQIEAGTANYAGSLMALKTIKSVFVGEDLIGGTTKGSGSIFSEQSINKVTVEGNLEGNDGEGSGCVEAAKRVGKATIGGDLIGGDGDKSGSVLSFGGKIGRTDHDGIATAGSGTDSGRFLSQAPERTQTTSSAYVYSYSTGSVFNMTIQAIGSDAFLANPSGNWHYSTSATSLIINENATLTITGTFSLPADTQVAPGGIIVVESSAKATLPDGSSLPPGQYTSETIAPFLSARPGIS